MPTTAKVPSARAARIVERLRHHLYPDALAGGPLAIDELAARVGADADALSRLLRALIGRGVFRLRRDGRYELNSLADTRRSGAPISMVWAARF